MPCVYCVCCRHPRSQKYLLCRRCRTAGCVSVYGSWKRGDTCPRLLMFHRAIRAANQAQQRGPSDSLVRRAVEEWASSSSTAKAMFQKYGISHRRFTKFRLTHGIVKSVPPPPPRYDVGAIRQSLEELSAGLLTRSALCERHALQDWQFKYLRQRYGRDLSFPIVRKGGAKPKLTVAQIHEVLDVWSTGARTKRELCEHYGISLNWLYRHRIRYSAGRRFPRR